MGVEEVGGGFLFNFIKKTTSLVVVSANVLYLHSNFSINSRKKLCLKIEESLISNGLLFYLENEYLMFLHRLPPPFLKVSFSPQKLNILSLGFYLLNWGKQVNVWVKIIKKKEKNCLLMPEGRGILKNIYPCFYWKMSTVV